MLREIKRRFIENEKKYSLLFEEMKMKSSFSTFAIFNFYIRKIFFFLKKIQNDSSCKTILLYILYKMFHKFLLNNRKQKKISIIWNPPIKNATMIESLLSTIVLLILWRYLIQHNSIQSHFMKFFFYFFVDIRRYLTKLYISVYNIK